MKKPFLCFGILTASAMLLLSSCDKKEEGLNIDNKTRNEFMATIQQCEAEDNIETKTYTDDGRRVLWRVDDRVSILQGRDVNEEFKVKKIFTGGTSAALEKVSGEVISPTTFDANIAYYPYYANMEYVGDNTNHAITVNIPSIQTYKENSFGVGTLPMVAVTKSKSDYDFEFKNLFGFLQLKLMTKDISYDVVNKIIIRGNNNEKISGEATVKCSSNGEPTIEFGDNAGTEIVLNCSNKRICTTTTEFWIALPPITFTKGITVEIVTLGNYPTKRQSSAPLTINRSKIKPMEVLIFTELSWVPIPDRNFGRCLLRYKIDNNNDGYISFHEVDDWNNSVAAENRVFMLDESHIRSLDGIEYFSITQLSCIVNQLTALDVSKNTALTYLNCSSNQLTSLDLSNNTALTELTCYNNQLTSLDVSKNTALTELICSNNKLTSLDVSKNTTLTGLSCYNNQLTSLDLSNCTTLTVLSCYNNQLTSLDLSNCTALKGLYCADNQLTSLDLSNCTALKELSCYDNQLTSLDLSNCTALKELSCYDNQLTSLDLSNYTALTYLYCDDNQLTSLDVSNNTALTYLYCDDNQLTSLDLSNCTTLTSLSCSKNQLTSLDVSKNTALTKLTCYDNQLTSLDLSKNTALTFLNCEMPSLKTLYLKKGHSINGITYNRSTNYINKNTEIVFVD